MPALVKVGYSMKDPLLRIEELGGTGLPHPCVLEYDVLVVDPRDIEQSVHARPISLHEAKEFFKCSVEVAVGAIRDVATAKSVPLISEFRRESSNSTARGIPKPYTRASESTCRICRVTVSRSEYRCPRCHTYVM
jgi:hypothetical protein